MADRVPKAPLSKEVLPPHNPSSGFGILMVASLAMFFAVASSAFVLRARMGQKSCSHTAPVIVHTTDARGASGIQAASFATPVEIEDHTAEEGGVCGTAIYRTNADNSVSVFFEVCPEGHDPSGIRSAEPASIEVRTIR